MRPTGYFRSQSRVLLSAQVTCPERLRLAREYRDSCLVYSEAVRKMTDLICKGVSWEVNVLRGGCRGAWDGTEKARLALARHEADHFCDRTDFASSVFGVSTV